MFHSLFRPKAAPQPEAVKPPGPPMSAGQFIEKFRRNYVNYAALVESTFGLGDEMFAEYERLSDSGQRQVIEYAKAWVKGA